MSPELQVLIGMLSCVKARGDQHSHCHIEETDPQASLKRITLTGLPADSLVIGPDCGRGEPPVMSPLFSRSKDSHHNKACDGLVLARQDGKAYAVFIELKSGRPSGHQQQFKSTRCFLHYLLELAEVFHGCHIQGLEERYIVFNTTKSGQRTLNKTTTRIRINQPSHDPEAPLFLPVSDRQSIFLAKLLG